MSSFDGMVKGRGREVDRGSVFFWLIGEPRCLVKSYSAPKHLEKFRLLLCHFPLCYNWKCELKNIGEVVPACNNGFWKALLL